MKNKSKASFICEEVFSVDNISKVIISVILVLFLIWTFTFPTNHIIWFGVILLVFICLYITCCIGGSFYEGSQNYKDYLIEENKKDLNEFNKDLDKKLEEIEKQKQKKKRLNVNIYFRDNTYLGYYSDLPLDTKETYFTNFYDFYKWLFFRESSEVYVWEHTQGASIFYKNDIKRVTFTEKIIEE